MKNNRIKELESLVLKHKELYYSGKKEIEDEEFDALEAELRTLDSNNYVLSVVGQSLMKGDKVKHDSKMLSLDKTYILDDLVAWMGKNELIGLYKIDGNSASVVYADGKLKVAKTRGDGVFGINILAQLLHIDSIPKEIINKEKIEVRGEVYCTQNNFELLVDEMVKRGIDRPKSLRNIVAGILGREDHKDLAKYLSFFAFDYITKEEVQTEENKLKKLEENKFIVTEYQLIKTEKDLINFIEKTEAFMDNGNYLIDGAVLCLNNIEEQNKLGYTSHHPKFKIAFKFKGDVAESKILNINWQISKSGILTPVGVIEPVELSGATITNVTFHNLKTVKTFLLKKDDTIKIIRSGEVIPKFLSVVNSSEGKIEIPDTCEYCKTNLIQEDIRLMCPNENCSGRQEEYILNFVQSIGIEDLSKKRLQQMIQNNLVNKITDLYRLTINDLLKLPSTKETMANKLYKNINKTKKVNLIKFLAALNFIGGAKKATELILENGVDSFDKLFDLKVENLIEIKGFAEKKAMDYVESLRINKELINELIELGFEIEFPKLKKNSDSLKGLSICITGSLEVIKNRKDLETLIKENGGSPSSSVTAKTNILICNEESSSSKYKQAVELKVKIMKDKEFLEHYKLI